MPRIGKTLMDFPLMYHIHQRLNAISIDDVSGAVRKELSRLKTVEDKVRPGQTVAVAVGSRGIHGLRTIVTTLISCLQSMGLKPFILPAMGSHGGATAEGQERVLKALGISEDTVGAPIVSSMDVVSVGHLDSGAEVFISKDAIEADHLIVINRVKPHTAFRGEVESGLCKMLVIGCGKHKGAETMHKFGLTESIVPAARVIIQKTPVLYGLAVVENATGGTHIIRLAQPDEFVDADRELLKEAWRLLAKIPLEDLDVLIVDEMGKDISGAGMDPNVIGFWRREGGPRTPDYRTVIVLDLTARSHGNAMGIGMADLTTRRVMDKIDLEATYTNVQTAGVLRSARLPIALESDRTVLEAALNQFPDLKRVRMVRIVNTLRLETFCASEVLIPELRKRDHIVLSEKPLRFQFNNEGRLLPFVD